MSALRAQNKLAMAASQGMKDSYDANSEVAAVRAQLAALPRANAVAGGCDGSEASRHKAGDAFGGVHVAAADWRRLRRCFDELPGSVLSFITLNSLFNTVLAPLSQNGIDMPPTKAEIDTWETGCKELTMTENAWKAALASDAATLNAMLVKGGSAPIKAGASSVTPATSCSFAAAPLCRK